MSRTSILTLEVRKLRFGLVLGNSVAVLDLAQKNVTLPADLGQVVVGQLSPFVFDVALEFGPLSFDAVPVHRLSPVVSTWSQTSRAAYCSRPNV
jgi:hypothetical protein